MNNDEQRQRDALEAAESGNLILGSSRSRHKIDAVRPLAELGLVDLLEGYWPGRPDVFAFRLA